LSVREKIAMDLFAEQALASPSRRCRRSYPFDTSDLVVRAPYSLLTELLPCPTLRKCVISSFALLT